MAIENIVTTVGDYYGTASRDENITPSAANSKLVYIAQCRGNDTFTITLDPTGSPSSPDGTVAGLGYDSNTGMTVVAGYWDGIGASAQTVRAAHTDTGGEDAKLFLFAFTGAASGGPEASDRGATYGGGSSPGAAVTASITVSEDAYIVGSSHCGASCPSLSSVDVITAIAATSSTGGAPCNRCGHTPTPGDTTSGAKSVTFTWDTAYGTKQCVALSFAPAVAGGAVSHVVFPRRF